MMPTYNGAKYIESAIDSILRQTFTDFELLIIDDGSTDETSSVVSKLAAIDERIQYRSRENRGIVASRNEIIEMARGEFISVLDHDDIAPPRRLEMAVEYLRHNTDYSVVGGDMEIVDSDGDTLVIWKMLRAHHEIDNALLKGGLVIGHPAATMRRVDVIAVGGYRKSYETAEDLDLFLRLAERGLLTNLPEIMVKYRIHHHNTGSSQAGVSKQANAAFRALIDCQKRRGLSGPIEPPLALIESPAQVHRKWAWWALSSGHVTTAKKHAIAALKLRPFSTRTWRLFWAIFGGRRLRANVFAR